MEKEKVVPLALKENAFIGAVLATGLSVDAFLIYYAVTKFLTN